MGGNRPNFPIIPKLQLLAIINPPTHDKKTETESTYYIISRIQSITDKPKQLPVKRSGSAITLPSIALTSSNKNPNPEANINSTTASRRPASAPSTFAVVSPPIAPIKKHLLKKNNSYFPSIMSSRWHTKLAPPPKIARDSTTLLAGEPPSIVHEKKIAPSFLPNIINSVSSMVDRSINFGSSEHPALSEKDMHALFKAKAQKRLYDKSRSDSQCDTSGKALNLYVNSSSSYLALLNKKIPRLTQSSSQYAVQEEKRLTLKPKQKVNSFP